jgi:hypothetical protein
LHLPFQFNGSQLDWKPSPIQVHFFSQDSGVRIIVSFISILAQLELSTIVHRRWLMSSERMIQRRIQECAQQAAGATKWFRFTFPGGVVTQLLAQRGGRNRHE